MADEVPDRAGWVTGPLSTYPAVPPFPSFTHFEQGVLETIAQHAEAHGDIFRQQLRAARVIDRINTIVGFYTRVAVDRAAAPPLPKITARLGGAQTELAEAQHGLVFIVEHTDGYFDQIEGSLNYSGCNEPEEDTLGGKDLAELTLRTVVFDDGLRVAQG